MLPHSSHHLCPNRKTIILILSTALTALVFIDFALSRLPGSPHSESIVQNVVRPPSPLRPADSSLGVDDPSQCSCHTERESIRRKDPCCRRNIFGVHKGGHLFVSQFRERFLPTVPSVFVRSNSTSTERMFDRTDLDYREVFVARDLYEMIVSGYLYHKSGRECWLDMFGNAQENENVLTQGTWESPIQRWKIKWSWPTVNNRSLCRYLSQESEVDGILVYTSYAIERWYRPFYELVEIRKQDRPMRTLFLDLQRLSDPLQQETLLLEVRHFLAPNAANDDAAQGTKSVPSSLISMKNTTLSFSMVHDLGHDTSHDSTLRSRLTDHILKVDEVVWDGWIATHHQWPPNL